MRITLIYGIIISIGLAVYAEDGLNDKTLTDPIHIERVDTLSVERKGASHTLEIILFTMVTLNLLFVAYCCVREAATRKEKERSKYCVVSSEEFQFDTVDVNGGRLQDLNQCNEDTDNDEDVAKHEDDNHIKI